MIDLQLPLTEDMISKLKIGDICRLNGIIYTARDCAHKRMTKNLDDLPFSLDGATIYYAGPCPSDKRPTGPCGPTTSKRMDSFTPTLIERGLRVMIGKGERSETVQNSIKTHNAVYFLAIGGAGALYSTCVEKSELIAYPDLQSEAVYKMTVKDFPVIVGIV